jgi:hypothetical protein
VILHVRRASHVVQDIEVPDNASASLAAAIVAWECGIVPLVGLNQWEGSPEPWKIVHHTSQHEGHMVPEYLHLNQTVQDIPDPSKSVFLLDITEGIKWN